VAMFYIKYRIKYRENPWQCFALPENENDRLPAHAFLQKRSGSLFSRAACET